MGIRDRGMGKEVILFRNPARVRIGEARLIRVKGTLMGISTHRFVMLDDFLKCDGFLV